MSQPQDPSNNSTYNKKSFLIFAFCLVISAFFWVLTNISRTYEVEVDIEVEATGLPGNKALAPQFPDRISASIETSGWNYIRLLNNSDDLKASINLSSFQEGQTVNLKERLKLESGGLRNAKVISVFPESAQVTYVNTEGKFVAVKLNPSGIPLAEDYGLISKVNIQPDSVWIKASKKYLDTLDIIELSLANYGVITQDFKETIEIINPDRTDWKYYPNEVKVSFDVGKITQRELMVPIVKPKKLAVELIPSMVSVQFSVPYEYYSQINVDSFRIGVDVTDIGEVELLEVIIEQQPKFVQSIQINPKYVNYIIRK